MTATGTLTLTDFLLARISEDEATTKQLAADYPFAVSEVGWHRNGDDVAIDVGVGRALAECEAKRRIVALHGDQHDCGDSDSWAWPYVGCATLRALALPFADHPVYRDEWRP